MATAVRNTPAAQLERPAATGTAAYSLHMDLFRGIAALVVMVTHQNYLFFGNFEHGSKVAGNSDNAPAGMGHYAVIVFFVLSGLLVGSSTLKSMRQNRFRWKRYLIHRLARLWTVLLPALLVGWAIDSWFLHHFYASSPIFSSWNFTIGLQKHLQWRTMVANALFLQGLESTGMRTFGTNAALWSLSYEFWYYIAFPFLAALLLVKKPLVRLCSLVGLLACMVFLWKKAAMYFSIWLIGVLIYLLPKIIPARLQKAANIFLGLIFLGTVIRLRTLHLPHFMQDLLLGILFGALMYGVLHRIGPVESRIYAWFARALAKPSYTLYLFHLPISILLCAYLRNPLHPWPHDLPHALAFLCMSAVVFGSCYLLYLCFEAQTAKIREFFESRLL